MPRFYARPLRAAAGVFLTLALTAGVPPAYGLPTDQAAPTAPENLRCPGKPFPPSPGPGWQVVPVWAWRDVLNLEGTVGSGAGPYAVALDRSCNIYFTDSTHFQTLKLSPDGTVVARWPLPGERAPGESSSPRGVAVDGQGNVYVTDTPRDRVYKYSPQGQVTATWGDCPANTPNCPFTDPGRFISPEGIAVDGAGNVYVAEAAGLRVQKLSSSGQSLGVWDLKARGLGELLIPGSLSVDQAGNVYLAEAYNHQIVKFEPGGGTVVSRWGGQPGRGPGELNGPQGVGVGPGGEMYISDLNNWRVQELAPDGAFITHWRLCLDGDPPCQFPDAGFEPGQFFGARGIAVDGQGTVYVADTNNQRLQRLMIVDFELIPPPPPPEEEANS